MCLPALFLFSYNHQSSGTTDSVIMTGEATLRITPDMNEDEIIQACAEAVVEESPDDIVAQLDKAAADEGYSSALNLVKANMKTERAQYETLEGWLAALPGRFR